MVGGALALAELVVDRNHDLAALEVEEAAGALVQDRQLAGRAVEHEQLAEVEQAQQPQLAREDGRFRGHQAACARGGAAAERSLVGSRSRLERCTTASSALMWPSRRSARI